MRTASDSATAISTLPWTAGRRLQPGNGFSGGDSVGFLPFVGAGAGCLTTGGCGLGVFGLDASIDVAIVVFGDQGFQIDMDPVAPGVQLVTSPSADADGDGVVDVEQVLRSLNRSDYGSAIRTDYAAALEAVAQTVDDLGLTASSMLFVSDGEPNDPNNYVDEVANLRDMGVTLSAFGAGEPASRFRCGKGSSRGE